MAAIAQYFQIPNNITSGTWNWGDVAYGFRSGLFLNQTPLDLIRYNKLPYPQNLDLLTLMNYVSFPSTTLSKVERLARSENWIATHGRVFELGAYALISANAYTVWARIYNLKISQVRSPKHKILITVWKMTPYLVLLTNIVLTIIEFRINRMKALVGLTVMAVTWIDQARVIPRSFARYIDPGIRLPMDFLALYYGSNKNRFNVVLGWAGVPVIRNPIIAMLPPKLKNYLTTFLREFRRE